VETLEETERFGRHLQKLKEKLKRTKDLLEELEKNIEESEEEFKGLDLSEVAKTEIKQANKIMQHLARANMLAVFAHTSHFRSLVKRITDDTGDILEEIEEELGGIKREKK
jgi:DNA replication protein DnaD